MKFCHFCGECLSEDSRFCNKCGKSVLEESASEFNNIQLNLGINKGEILNEKKKAPVKKIFFIGFAICLAVCAVLFMIGDQALYNMMASAAGQTRLTDREKLGLNGNVKKVWVEIVHKYQADSGKEWSETLQYEFDKSGNLISEEKYGKVTNAKKIYEYDKRGRLLRIEYKMASGKYEEAEVTNFKYNYGPFSWGEMTADKTIVNGDQKNQSRYIGTLNIWGLDTYGVYFNNAGIIVSKVTNMYNTHGLITESNAVKWDGRKIEYYLKKYDESGKLTEVYHDKPEPNLKVSHEKVKYNNYGDEIERIYYIGDSIWYIDKCNIDGYDKNNNWVYETVYNTEIKKVMKSFLRTFEYY